jgi:hypothetical protein
MAVNIMWKLVRVGGFMALLVETAEGRNDRVQQEGGLLRRGVGGERGPRGWGGGMGGGWADGMD